jgi:hypothetical protein
VSTAPEEMTSPERQRAAIQQWAERTGGYVVEWGDDFAGPDHHDREEPTRGVN